MSNAARREDDLVALAVANAPLDEREPTAEELEALKAALQDKRALVPADQVSAMLANRDKE